MSDFTPGPWGVDPKASLLLRSLGGRAIASFGVHNSNVHESKVIAENEANIKLCAAAPDLHEAITKALDWLNSWGCAGGYGLPFSASEKIEIENCLEAALAKAGGESS